MAVFDYHIQVNASDPLDQMMAYAHLYKAPGLTLLYPHHDGWGSNEGLQAPFRITGQDTVVETTSTDVANGKDLVARLRDQFLPTIW